MTTYISIDVATRSLAVGLYRLRSFVGIEGGAPRTDALALNDYCDEVVVPVRMCVFDLGNGAKARDVSIDEKARALRRALTQFDSDIGDLVHGAIVLVEYQMNANHMSNAVFNMIIYHYAHDHRVEVVPPSWKNTIALHPQLQLCEFLAHCSSNYKANKEHTRWNMLYLLAVLGKTHLIAGIKKQNQDDIADTLCQALAWHRRHGA